MKIGIIAPLRFPIPPVGYGGTEQVIYYLVEGLVKKGHEVTLFGCSNSKTSAKIYPEWNSQLDGSAFENSENTLYYLERFNQISRISDQFDVIHNHDGFLTLSQNEHIKCPFVSTFHLSPSALVKSKPRELIMERNKLVSISLSQQRGYPKANWIDNVYNGTVDLEKYEFGEGGDYLVWIGRFNPIKGAKEAIEIAKLAKHKLILGGVVDPEHVDYFEQEIKPKIDGTAVVFLGEVNLPQKIKLLKNAKAFLMPISWEEPFGLVVIESMACGTPVIAFDCGSMSEIIENGKTGFVIESSSVKEAAEAVGRISEISRKACRDRVSKSFSIEKMVDGYESVYSKIVGE